MEAVITVVGVDRTGIIATVSQVMAEHKINILTINQVILDGLFNMVMIADLQESCISFAELQDILRHKGEGLGVQIMVQNKAIFDSMHRVG